jgi:hypothetical protein
MHMNMAPESNIRKPVPAHMDRCLIIRIGSDAVFGIMIWTTTNATADNPAATNNTITRQSLHEYFEPPHFRTSTRETSAGTKKSVPRGSRRIICSLMDAGFEGLFGEVRKKNRQATVTTPTGRLM